MDNSEQHFALPDDPVHEDLHRRLKERHIQMIAIGGAIGVGLFLGSAHAIQQAGPSLLLAYVVAGFVIFLIMRALGELLLYRPVAGSFATYADEFVGPWAGFATAWTYWLMWVVIRRWQRSPPPESTCSIGSRGYRSGYLLWPHW